MNVLEFDGLIKMNNIGNCGLVRFAKTCELLLNNSITYRTHRDVINENEISKMYIIFDDVNDYNAYLLIKD